MSQTKLEEWIETCVNISTTRLSSRERNLLESFYIWLTSAAEQRNEAEGEQTCPSCSGVGHYLVGMFHETCSWCEGTGHV